MSYFINTKKYENISDVGNALNKIRIIREGSRKEYHITTIQKAFNEIMILFGCQNTILEDVKQRINIRLGDGLEKERVFLLSIVDLYGFQMELNKLREKYKKLKEILEEKIKKEEDLYVKSSFRGEKSIKLKEMELHNNFLINKLKVLDELNELDNLEEFKRLLEEFKGLIRTSPISSKSIRQSFFSRFLRGSRKIEPINTGGRKIKNSLSKRKRKIE